MNIQDNKKYIDHLWEKSIIPTLMEYITIPNKSPAFDSQWQEHGYMDKAVKLLVNWCQENAVPGMKLDVIQLPNRTPIIFIEIPGNSDDTVLLYGHLDKQPEMTGWDPDLGPWKPVLRGDKLYGRGGADDGYSTFASLAAIKSLHSQNIPHARCIILIEACEESGSHDLPYYIEALENRIGSPSLIICLDSGCANYNQLWITTSLRGIIGGILHIDVLKQGVHSGIWGGLIPSCSIILRQLLDRIEDVNTGKVLLQDLYVDIPEQRIEQAKKMSNVLGHDIYKDLPLYPGVKPLPGSEVDHILNRTWNPAFAITGIDGLPKPENAGNVTLPWMKVKISMRVPPTANAKVASEVLKKTLEIDPPFNAKVKFEIKESENGWSAPLETPWLTKAANEASQHYFGNDAVYMGEGASIPFMGMLGKKFPQAQFLITGLLGPGSNAHGPNEFLHIPSGKNLTCCVAEIIANHFRR